MSESPFPLHCRQEAQSPQKTLTVTLTSGQAERIECVVRSGAYASSDDILREAVELWLKGTAAASDTDYSELDAFLWGLDEGRSGEGPGGNGQRGEGGANKSLPS